MTIGIYALYWEEQDLVYIGQSQNIEARFKEHSRKMLSQKHSNYKVQDTYNLYGAPKFIVIEECSIEENNNQEIYWTKEFNSLNMGLNIIEAGDVGWGTNSNSSKYSKYQILKVFACLSSGRYLSHKDISKRLGIPNHLISDVYTGNTHSWLKESYPTRYVKMLSINYRSLAHSGIAKGKVYSELMSPEGTIFKITTSVIDFAKTRQEISLDYEQVRKGFSRLLSGKISSYYGWKLHVY